MSATRNDGWVIVDHGAFVGERVVCGFPLADVADILDKAEALGLPMGDALEDVTVMELKLLTQDLTTN